MVQKVYQDVIKKGAFPTVSWFEHLPRTDGDVLDVGCAEGTFSYLFKITGAKKVTGIDINKVSNYTNEGIDFVRTRAEDFDPQSYDLVLFSMIIHWLDNPIEVIRKIGSKTRKYLCFIFRLPNTHYKTPANGSWFPDSLELTGVVRELGFIVSKYIPKLMVQDNDKTICLMTFERKWMPKRGKFCTQEWLAKMDQLGFIFSRIDGGYMEDYFDGTDLQEDRPFAHRHDVVRYLALTPTQRQNVRSLFKKIVGRAIKTGYLLADFTRRNVILVGDEAHLIDFDIIINVEPEKPIPSEYIRIFQEMIDYLEIDYIFDGNLKKLHGKL